MKLFFIILILALSVSICDAQKKDTCCHVELYLLNGTYTFRPDGFSPIGYYMPVHAYLADTPLVHDDEITGYEVPRDSTQPFYLNLKESTAHRLDSIAKKAPLFDGLPIAVVVDGEPVYGVYLWNINSSFGCDWILAIPCPGRLVFYPGVPHYCFSAVHPDPRKNPRLIGRMEQTGRVINH